MSTATQRLGQAIPAALDALSFKSNASGVAYLPGLDPSNGRPETRSHEPEPGRFSAWWVRRSAKQVTDAAGQPVGFRHQLMYGREVVKSGVDADSGRTFQRQADFMNAMDKRALQRVVTTVDAHFVSTSPA